MGEVTPLFICGMGRSGTTNALRILNAHPSVMLNGEVALSVQKYLFALLDGADRSYSAKDGVNERWHERKVDYIFDSFGYLSKGGRGKLTKVPEARYRGHKTPRMETFFDQYERHFGDAGLPPRYFFCTRNPFDCWRSYKVMTWNRYTKVDEFLAHYVQSFENLQRMRDQAGGRVWVLNLDELKAAPDAIAWYGEKIFAPLGLDTPDSIARRADRMNREKQASSPPPIGAEEQAAIAAHPQILPIVTSMFPEFAARARK